MSVEIKIPRGAAQNIRDVTEKEWMTIKRDMLKTFENYPPDRPHGLTIKRVLRLKAPEFRYRFKNWRVGYNVRSSFLGKIVYIYCCEDRRTFYNTLKRIGVWK